jgi:hypothetical protein
MHFEHAVLKSDLHRGFVLYVLQFDFLQAAQQGL